MAMQTTPAISWIHGSRVDVAATLGDDAAVADVEAAPDSDAELSGWLAEAIFPPPKGAGSGLRDELV